MTSLCIVQETGGRGRSIAKVMDRQVLAEVAALAIAAAEARARAEDDPAMALVEHEEAERLRRTLTALIPELNSIALVSVM